MATLEDNGSDFRNNYLYTDDLNLRDFLNTKQRFGNWESSQGIPASVPDVVAMTQTTAASAITAEGLLTGTITSGCSDSISEGNVIDSEPDAGTWLVPGDSVSFIVSTGSCTASVDVADEAGGSDGGGGCFISDILPSLQIILP